MVIYADLIFLINTVSDILLFSAYRYITHSKTSMVRITAVSVFGGMYSVLESVFRISCYVRPAVLTAMCALIWGHKNAVKNTINIYSAVLCVEGITMLFVSCMGADAYLAAGTVTVFIPKLKLFAAAAASYILYAAVKIYLKKAERIKRTELVINKRKTALDVLYDSGNLLRYKNKPVMIVCFGAVKDLLNEQDYNSFFNRSEAFVHYSTIRGDGIAPVLEPESLSIDGRRSEAAVAVVREELGEGYQGIIGG